MIQEEELLFWLALHRAPQVGSRRFMDILRHFGTAKAIFDATYSEWESLRLPDCSLAYLRNPNWQAVMEDMAWLDKQPYHTCLTIYDPLYPTLLGKIHDPPPVLFCVGNVHALSCRHIAIVGSRNPSHFGVRAAHDFAMQLASAQFGIVSGLAFGIDAAGHQGALDGKGITVAVAGTGPDIIYPRQHRALVEDIIAHQGILISEFPPGIQPKAGNFPCRNRIISGLSLGVLVVEAAARSGSLITARLALEQDREVFAIPGSIYNPLSQGCNDLIKSGAKLVQSAQDILEEFAFGVGLFSTADEPSPYLPSGVSSYPALLKQVAYDYTSVDTLVAITGQSADNVTAQLLVLELEGYVASVPGGGYVRLK